MKTLSPVLVHVTTVADSTAWFRGQGRYMMAAGYDVHFISSPGPQLDSLEENGEGTSHPLPMRRSISPTRDIISLIKMVLLFSDLRPAIVHAHTPKAGLLGMTAAWLLRVPLRIYHLHGLRHQTMTGTMRRLVCFFERLSCRLATKVLSVSHSVMREVAADRLCSKDKIVVLGKGSVNGIDALETLNPSLLPRRKIDEMRHQLGIESGDFVIGFVGRVTVDKGVIALFHSWNALKSDFPRLHMLIVGSYDATDPIPEEIRSRLESDQDVHLIGRVASPAPLYRMMDVFVLASYREGLPSSVLEASAMQIPVVANKVTGCVDAVIDGKTGFLVDPHDTGCLTEKIRTYLHDLDLRQRHGFAGRRFVLESFRPKHVWDRTLREYDFRK